MNTTESQTVSLLSKDESLRLMTLGVERFNSWRKENPFLALDLSGEDLTNFDFTGYNFTGFEPLAGTFEDPAAHPLVIFRGSTLRKLDNVTAYYADFSSTDLNGSFCRQESLSDRRSFWGANFSRAYLVKADFTSACLAKANLSEANVSHAIFKRANLTDLLGLETAKGVGYADWRYACSLSPLNKALIVRLVIHSLEASWQSCYDHWQVDQLSSGRF